MKKFSFGTHKTNEIEGYLKTCGEKRLRQGCIIWRGHGRLCRRQQKIGRQGVSWPIKGKKRKKI